MNSTEQTPTARSNSKIEYSMYIYGSQLLKEKKVLGLDKRIEA